MNARAGHLSPSAVEHTAAQSCEQAARSGLSSVSGRIERAWLRIIARRTGAGLPPTAGGAGSAGRSTGESLRKTESERGLNAAGLATSAAAMLSTLLRRAWTHIEARRLTQRHRSLRVLETVGMGEKRFVAIVQVEGARFLVGGGSAGVSLLSRLDPEPEFAAVLGEQATVRPAHAPSAASSFVVASSFISASTQATASTQAAAATQATAATLGPWLPSASSFPAFQAGAKVAG